MHVTPRLLYSSTFLLLLSAGLVGATTIENDVIALKALYVATGGGNWTYHTLSGQSWVFGPTADPCGDGWKGVTCNSTQAVCSVSACAVTDIGLAQSSLVGELPSQLGDIEKLQTLQFQSNELTGIFPKSLYHLSNITTIDLNHNQLQGPISSDIKFATSLETLRLDDNKLSGPLPETIGEVSNLAEFGVSGSRINGSIPETIGSLVKLKVLNLGNCALQGTIPESVAFLTQLYSFYAGNNSLEGTVPQGLFEISSLQFLSLPYNSLAGSIPSFKHLNSLRGLSMSDNRLTGSIPTDIDIASDLLIIDLTANRLKSSIPSQVYQLTKMRYLFLGDNKLNGGFTESVSNFVALQELDLHKNNLGGTIPEGLFSLTTLHALYLDQSNLRGTISSLIGNLVGLKQFSFEDNHFVSKLPSSMVKLSALEVLTGQKNAFTGEINDLFSDENVALRLIDLSQNALTGSLHPSFFLLPNLTTVSLMGNCFSGTLSPEICQSNSLQLLLLDGLNSGSHCQLRDYDLLNILPTYTAKSMGGSIPSCFFSMGNLSTLHLSGNGFQGEIDGSLLQHESQLQILTLSHNRITGTIPDQFQQHDWKELDLQYNRLTGTLDKMTNVNQRARLKLEHNRLSGKITESLRTIRDAEILDGNRFQCQSRNDLPESDPLKEDYACGSSELDATIYTTAILGAIFFVALLCGGILIFLNRRHDQFWPAGRRLADYLSDRYNYFVRCMDKISQLSHVDMHRGSDITMLNTEASESSGVNIPNLWLFVNTLIEMTRWKFYVVLVILFLFMPAYVGFKEGASAYSTYTHQYWYVICALYLKGVTPAVVLFSIWLVLVTAMTIFAYGRHSSIRDNPFYRKLRRTKKSVVGKIVLLNNRMVFLLVLMMICNLVVVFLFNGLYVFTTLSKVDSFVKTLAEVSLAGFQLLWNSVVVPKSIEWLTRMWSASFDDKIWLNIVVLIFNSVCVPCLISAVTDIDCFQYAFVNSPVVQSSYSFYTCEIYDLRDPDICIYEREIRANTEFVSAFVYNYSCTSSLLYNFIPVFMYKFIYIAFIDPIVFMRVCSIESNRVPNWIRSMMPGILWPKESHATTPQRIFKPSRILCQNLSDLAILLTFGIMCPPLAVLILLACCVVTVKWQMLLGRYLIAFEKNTSDRSVSDVGRSIDWLSVLDIRCNFIWRGPWMVHWAILWTSGIFFSFYFLDIASDEVGAPESLWVGTLPLIAAMCIWLGWVWWRYMYPFVSELADSAMPSSRSISTWDTHNIMLQRIAEDVENVDGSEDGVGGEQEMINLPSK